MMEAMWRRAKTLRDGGTDVDLVPVLRDFWGAGDNATVQQYLRIEEFTVLQQVQQWTGHSDKPLADLARRFLDRNRYAAIDPPQPDSKLAGIYTRWEAALHEKLRGNGYDCMDTHCLQDEVKAKYNQPYFPEKENDQQSARNAIRVRAGATGSPVEISTILDRLRPVAERPAIAQVRYYVPCNMRLEIQKLKDQWSPQL